MPAVSVFPSYAKILVDGHSRNRQDPTVSLNMESGPNQKLLKFTSTYNWDSVTIRLYSNIEYDNFIEWYKNTIQVVGWFYYVTGDRKNKLSRFKNDIGEQKIIVGGIVQTFEIKAIIEYLS